MLAVLSMSVESALKWQAFLKSENPQTINAESLVTISLRITKG